MRKSLRLVLAIPLLVFIVASCLFGPPKKVVYEPSSPEVEQLAIATSMTPVAQQLFYQQNPTIAPKEELYSICRKAHRNPKESVLLGCYKGHTLRQGAVNLRTGQIFIQSVSDPRLRGKMEVAAAHELLHAAYHQKLNAQDRSELISKLVQAADRVNNPFLSPIIDEYRKGNPDVYHDELHSYLGTELEDLGDPSLEAYYQKYFNDRQAIIGFYRRSNQELKKLESQTDQLEAEIDRLEASLKSEESSLKQASDDLDNSAQNLDQMRSDLFTLKQQAENALRQGDSSLVTEFEIAQSRFNSEVQYYNSRVESHRDRVARFNQDYETYKQKIQAYNQVNQNKRDIFDVLKLNPAEVNVAPVQ